jgi:hypothetical protein
MARQVLTEKASAKEVLEKTSAKAQVNYQLAAALAQKIGAVFGKIFYSIMNAKEMCSSGTKQLQILDALKGSSISSQPQHDKSSSWADSNSNQSGFNKPKWQQSLEEAKARIR